MVARFTTTQGAIYLKHTPDQLALEAPIFSLLHDRYQINVPKVIAYSSALKAFLMLDAGRCLRDVLTRQFDISLLIKAINQFTSVQITMADHVSDLLKMGVPDWRLDQLPTIYAEMLSQYDLLTEAGLSEHEIKSLKLLQPTLEKLCEQLSAFTIAPSIVQPDFHDNNIVINEDTGKISFIDLGEIVISHPFFSFIGCLYQIDKHHGITDQGTSYQQLIDDWQRAYTDRESKANICDALRIAKRLYNFYWPLSGYRLLVACNPVNLHAFQPNKLAYSLRKIIDECSPLL